MKGQKAISRLKNLTPEEKRKAINQAYRKKAWRVTAIRRVDRSRRRKSTVFSQSENGGHGARAPLPTLRNGVPHDPAMLSEVRFGRDDHLWRSLIAAEVGRRKRPIVRVLLAAASISSGVIERSGRSVVFDEVVKAVRRQLRNLDSKAAGSASAGAGSLDSIARHAPYTLLTPITR